MANSNRSPKELKGLIERSKSTTNLYKQKLSQATKSSHNFDQRSVPYSSTNFYTKPIIYDQNIRPKTEIELLNSQIEEQCRLITFYKVSFFNYFKRIEVREQKNYLLLFFKW